MRVDHRRRRSDIRSPLRRIPSRPCRGSRDRVTKRSRPCLRLFRPGCGSACRPWCNRTPSLRLRQPRATPLRVVQALHRGREAPTRRRSRASGNGPRSTMPTLKILTTCSTSMRTTTTTRTSSKGGTGAEGVRRLREGLYRGGNRQGHPRAPRNLNTGATGRATSARCHQETSFKCSRSRRQNTLHRESSLSIGARAKLTFLCRSQERRTSWRSTPSGEALSSPYRSISTSTPSR